MQANENQEALSSFAALLTPAGQEALQAAQSLRPREEDFLNHFGSLCRSYPSPVARLALQIAILRMEGREKFPLAEQMYFTRAALEQASAYEISTYRARRFQGYAPLFDLGCSIGGDTLALAEIAPTVGLDLDRLRLVMAKENLTAAGLERQALFLCADLNRPLPFQLPPDAGLFFDPARRANGRRIFSVGEYRPPLRRIEDWIATTPALGVKISPGVKMAEIETLDAEVEFISLRGELKEAVLWFGPLKRSKRRATILPGPFTMVVDVSDEPAAIGLSEPRTYLYEPDPAVLRAGLVRRLATQLDAAQLDTQIAYLTSDGLRHTPFARAWSVQSWFPFNLKRLRAELRRQNVGEVIVKKRGSPLQPEELIRRLHLKGDQRMVVFLTHLRGRPIVILSAGEARQDIPDYFLR